MRAYEWQYAAVTGQMCNLINYQTNERDNLCGNLHAERRGRKDNPDSACGKLPALCERLQRGRGGLRLSAVQYS
ncbi:hypothetical protein NXW10_23330 [Bacteroides fragilis]|nr:hypothetical protein NXW10_23330 [Bacteroides fragilis]